MDFRFHSHADYTVSRKRKFTNRLLLKGRWFTEHWRNGLCIGKYETHNDIVNEGKNDIFNVYFFSGTQTATASWFVGLINNAGFSALNAADVMNSHAGWAEFTTYS